MSGEEQPRTRNSKGREIWFERKMLWGSSPIHWKGVALLVIGVAVGLGGSKLADAFQQPAAGTAILVAAVVAVFVMAGRHNDR